MSETLNVRNIGQDEVWSGNRFRSGFDVDGEGEGRRVKEIREEMGLGEIFVKES